MSRESATAFAQAAMEDAELRERTAKLAPEELFPIAREMGYDFTAEELEAAMNEDRAHPRRTRFDRGRLLFCWT